MAFFGQQSSTPAFGSLPIGQQSHVNQPSLFGQPQQQQQQQQTPSPFGAQAAKPSLFAGFGSQPTASAAPAGSTLFGSQQPAPAAGAGLFGSTQQQQPATGGSLFGTSTTQQPAQPAAGAGLFGSSTQQPSSLFGGGQQQQQQQQAAPSGSSLFGSSTSAPQPAAGGGLFGSTAPAPTSSLFGASTAAQTPGSGLLGSTTTAPPGGGLFGSTPSGGGLFGSSTTAAPGGSSLFGQPQTQTPSLFGQTQPQQQQTSTSSIFGQSSAAPSTGLFNTSTNPSFLGSTRPNGVASGQGDPAAQHAALSKQIEAIVGAWNPSSPDCAFQYFFYNLVDPAQVALYRRPDEWTNTALWERAVRENPDPTCMVPVLAVGFDHLQRRVAAQDKTQSEHSAKLKELSSRLEALSQKHVLSNAVRTARARTLQAQLSARLIRLVQHLHLLIPSVRSSAIRPEEEALRAALEAIEDELKKPGGMGRVRGKLNELWALLGAVSAQRERERRARPDGPGWTVADDEGLQRITQILKEQQHGLAHITNILRDDMRDVAIMESGGTAAALPSSASFNASQNSLAASSMLRR